MRHKTLTSMVIVFFIAVFFCMNLISFEAQEKKSDEKKSEKLIRIDLLKRKGKEINDPIRNIFIEEKKPKKKVLKSGGIASSERSGGSLGIKEEDLGQDERISSRKFPGLNLKYLGYIVSLGKKVALLSYKGKVFAVEKGSILPEGIEILDISLDHVTIKSPDSDKLVIKLEGEEK